jgi:hypothetical protein
LETTICEALAMQLNGANLLIAAQQAARQAPQAQPNAKAFSAALASGAARDGLFAPLDFKQTAPLPRLAPTQSASPLLGTHLDIRI